MTHNTKLREFVKQIAEEQGFLNCNIQITPINSGGANFSSLLYKAKIEESKRVVDLFIKVAVMNEQTRDAIGLKMYEEEQFVYTRMKNKFAELEDKYNVPEEDRLMMPKYYGAITTPGEEMLVLEDLTVRGFGSYDRMKSIDWNYASGAVKELAKFHALTMAFQKECLHDHEEFLEKFSFNAANDSKMFEAFWKSGFDRAVKSTKDETNKEKLQKFYGQFTPESIWDVYKPVDKLVLIHFDFRVSNLMHRYREDGSAEVIPIDYQTLQGGCVVLDLLYFIFLGSDEEFRRQHFDQLVEYYYSQLKAAMTRLGLTDEDYSRKNFDHELKKKLPFGLLVAAGTLPIVTVESNSAPKLDNGLEMSSFMEIKSNDLFTERLTGIVNDFVRWGII